MGAIETSEGKSRRTVECTRAATRRAQTSFARTPRSVELRSRVEAAVQQSSQYFCAGMTHIVPFLKPRSRSMRWTSAEALATCAVAPRIVLLAACSVMTHFIACVVYALITRLRRFGTPLSDTYSKLQRRIARTSGRRRARAYFVGVLCGALVCLAMVREAAASAREAPPS